MTELFKLAVKATEKLPEDLQDEIAQTMLAMAETPQGVYVLSPEEKASLAESLAQAERGEFATDEEVEAIWAKFDR